MPDPGPNLRTWDDFAFRPVSREKQVKTPSSSEICAVFFRKRCKIAESRDFPLKTENFRDLRKGIEADEDFAVFCAVPGAHDAALLEDVDDARGPGVAEAQAALEK